MKMLDDIELDNPAAWLVTLVMWGVCMVILWKLQVMGTITTLPKILISVISFPILFAVVSIQINR